MSRPAIDWNSLAAWEQELLNVETPESKDMYELNRTVIQTRAEIRHDNN